ncbi:lysylphosphatidylglycerol synthase domain-containing protein [Lyngbya aestuarii]|uniref:lysylphosphatidylglycerol synthase domain-containing protein n=1 Tax=Lyngbya aestuarii TaxID=118322 RepID=UPI00403DC3E4
MIKKLLHLLAPLFGLVLFGLSLWAISNQLRHYHLSEVLKSFAGIPKKRLFTAIGCTALGYLVMAGYDLIAFRYLRRSLTPGAIIFTAFVSYAISNSVGLAILAGSAIRYRLYSHWGVSAKVIAKVIAFVNLSFWLGLFAVGGVIFLFKPLTIPTLLDLPFVSVRPLGVIFLACVSTYLLRSFWHQRSLKIFGRVISFPSFEISLAQIGVSLLDWSLAVGTLYILLPKNTPLSYPGFAGIYLLAMTASIISNVPGGLGVFETVILLMLPPQVPAPEVLGSLLAYRGVYYLLPLIVAVGLLAAHEIRRRLKVSS